MSEEEIVETIKQIIDKGLYIDSTPENTTIEAHEAIQGLLDLYNKEKEKNKEYEDGKIFSSKQAKYIEKIIKEKTKTLETEYLIQRDLINANFLKDYISKDKIREIIYPTPENYISLDIQQSEMYKRLEKLLED